MPNCIRRPFAALAACLLLLASAAPAAAYSSEEHANTPIVFDAVVVRPIGFATFLFGCGLFVASLPLIAVTIPQDIDKPFATLVKRPASFVWQDELGGH